jgi:hypothetical protein
MMTLAMTRSQPLSFVEINSNSCKYYIVLIITFQLCFVHYIVLYIFVLIGLIFVFVTAGTGQNAGRK